MDDHGADPEIQVFVVRFWREPGGSAGDWRGQVEHVPTGKRWPVSDLSRLMESIQGYLGPVAPGRKPPPVED